MTRISRMGNSAQGHKTEGGGREKSQKDQKRGGVVLEGFYPVPQFRSMWTGGIIRRSMNPGSPFAWIVLP